VIRLNSLSKRKEWESSISNPSEKLLKAIEELRRNKLTQLEKLRNMKPEEFSRRVILT
jgi:Txe/YoeB family toxin of Txe-Axe toxin-antitoxin module